MGRVSVYSGGGGWMSWVCMVESRLGLYDDGEINIVASG